MQRAIWIVTFLIILAAGYYWVIIHEADVKQVEKIALRNELQSDSINTVTELQNRLELKYIGHGKHLKSIQDDFNAHYSAYLTKMDSINSIFDELDFKVQNLSDRMNKKLDGLRQDFEEFTDDYNSNYRVQNRRITDVEKAAVSIEDDIKAINETLLTLKEKLDKK